jgi:hypothetical protein
VLAISLFVFLFLTVPAFLLDCGWLIFITASANSAHTRIMKHNAACC